MKTAKREIDDLPIEFEEEPTQPTDRHIQLTPQQAIELTICSCLKVGARYLFKTGKRFDSVLQINGSLRPGEVIAETNSAVFILSPRESESIAAVTPLMVPDHLVQEVTTKDKYYKGIIERAKKIRQY